MNTYQIRNELVPCKAEELHVKDAQFVAVLSTKEWEDTKESFNMGIDMDMDIGNPRDTKAIVNIDSLTGTYSRPALASIHSHALSFAFALDETGVVLVDDSGAVGEIVEQIRRSKRWKLPGMERFLYDLLETVIRRDLSMLETMEQRLNGIETAITSDQLDICPPELNEIRGDLLDLQVHYEQLIDLGQELEENENGFFREETLRYFHMFTERVIRLQTVVSGQREYVMQLRDLLQSNLDLKQNRIMTVLTVITSIFLPLTLIAGWYGMNFRYMPELNWIWGYPAVIVVSILIVIGCLIVFKKKKWL